MSSDKKGSGGSNPIDAIAGEISNGINAVSIKMIEGLTNIIKLGIDSLVSRSGGKKKESAAISIKKGFRK